MKHRGLPSLAAALQAGEGAQVEFKVNASSPIKIAQEACAFANAHGGLILVGVDDRGTVVGLKDARSDEARLAQAIPARLTPTVIPALSVESVSGKEVVAIAVFPNQADEPIAIRDKNGTPKVYERSGSVSQPVDPARVEELRADLARFRAFDTRTTDLSFDDGIDFAVAEDRFQRAGQSFDEVAARSCGLARETNGRLLVTNAGLLLLGRRPQSRFPSAFMRCMRFTGTEKVTSDRDVSLTDIPLVVMVEKAHELIADWTGEIRVPSGAPQATVITPYSPIVMRELLANAIAHADYRATSNFSLFVFSDRIELVSPGRWVRGMSEQALRSGTTDPRNRAISDALRWMKYVEGAGSAWAKARAEHRAHDYPLPTWQESGHTIRVTVPIHPRALANITGLQQALVDVLPFQEDSLEAMILTRLTRGQAWMSRRELQGDHVHPKAAQRALATLVEAGWVIASTDSVRSPNRKYRLLSPLDYEWSSRTASLRLSK